MARPHNIWYRKQTDWWMVKINGAQVKLIKGKANKAAAEKKFYELMVYAPRVPESTNARTVDLVEAFLRHSRIHFAPDTHRINQYYCQLFAEACGQVAARDLRPFHVAKWIDPKVESGAWGENTVYNARRTAFRVFSWALQEKIMPFNPLAGLKRPQPAIRRRALTEDEFRQLYEYAGGPFRDFLLALYLTGARPKEIRELTWDQVREDRWILEKHKTRKATGQARQIFLPQAIRDMMVRLKASATGKYVFLNTEESPWTQNAVRLQIWRIKTKTGMAADVCSYLCRRGFGTRAILNGVDGRTLAELMGHSSQEMINKVYVHLADQRLHLTQAVEKATSTTPLPVDSHPVQKRAKAVPKSPAA